MKVQDESYEFDIGRIDVVTDEKEFIKGFGLVIMGPDEGPSQDGAKGHKIIEHIKFKDMSNLKLAQMGLELIQEALERESE